MAFEALGHWDSAAVEHIHRVADFASKSGESGYTRGEVYRGLVEEISVALVRGVGSIILQGQQLSRVVANGLPPNCERP